MNHLPWVLQLISQNFVGFMTSVLLLLYGSSVWSKKERTLYSHPSTYTHSHTHRVQTTHTHTRTHKSTNHTNHTSVCQDNRQTNGWDDNACGEEDAQLYTSIARRIKVVCKPASDNSGYWGQHVEEEDKHRPPVADGKKKKMFWICTLKGISILTSDLPNRPWTIGRKLAK